MNMIYIGESKEDLEQEAVIEWAHLSSGAWPELALLHHIPNGGKRNKKEAAKLNRMGVLAGVPDLHLPVACAGYNGLYIEMKYGDGRPSQEQKDFLKKAAHYHNFCVVCYSADDAIEVLRKYIDHRVAFKFENLSILKNGKLIGKIQ